MQQWQLVFLIGAAMLLGCGIVYVLFADANLQSWNSPQTSSGAADKEMQPLQTEHIDDKEQLKEK